MHQEVIVKKEAIIQAWKNPEFRARLSDEERAALPSSPVGRALTELTDAELHVVAGMGNPTIVIRMAKTEKSESACGGNG
jgi:mersacidin/lichenicidin family type 2 lantibiotic